jgi:hypothetical protein
MSNEIESKMTMTPPIRRVAADASLTIPLNNNQMKKMKKASYNLVKQSTKINNQSTTVLRERSTSSSSKSSMNDSLKSLSANLSLNQDDDDDDDDASSNDETNHQWDLDQIASNIQIRQLSKSSI